MSENFKVITLGDYGVGKSSIILRVCENKFFERPMKTLGINFIFILGTNYLSKIIDNLEIRLYDTKAEERFRLTNQYYYEAKGVLLIFDVTNRNSFENLNYSRLLVFINTILYGYSEHYLGKMV